MIRKGFVFLFFLLTGAVWGYFPDMDYEVEGRDYYDYFIYERSGKLVVWDGNQTFVWNEDGQKVNRPASLLEKDSRPLVRL